MSFDKRRKKLRELIREAKADALLITSFINVTYLTGFTGDDSYLLVTLDGECLITDPRYTTQLEEECPGLALEIRAPGVKMLTAVVKVLSDANVGRLGLEGASATVAFERSVAKELPKCAIVVTERLVAQCISPSDRKWLVSAAGAGGEGIQL